jgi:hypothetical protein
MSKASNTRTNKFSGIYLSDYTYHSSSKDADLQSKHYIRLFPKGNEMVIESVPELNDSYMLARFAIDGNVATGSWQTATSPKGDYQGVIYHGAAQMIISEDGKHFDGKWVGFGKNMEVKTGPWEFTYIGEDVADVHEKAAGQ